MKDIMIHTVRKPFFCRDDQFKKHGYPGQVLVVGISLAALTRQNPYRFRIGKNATIYTGNSVEVARISTVWKNKKGKLVAIVPVDAFDKEV